MAEADRIFLSYGRGDVYPKGTDNPVEREAHFTIVEKVYKYLQTLGLKPWLDKFDLTADCEFTDSISQAIENSRYLLLFIGDHAMNSEWCAREWKHALKHCVPIIPILLKGDWGDKDIQKTYPPRILNTTGIVPQNEDGTINDDYLKAQIERLVVKIPASLAIPYNARSLPSWYIERRQYTDAIKEQLSVNDRKYSGANVVGITSQQEVASMQGIGGIGKTTLALAVVADCDVRRNFDQIFWLNVGPEVIVEDLPRLMDTISNYIDEKAMISEDYNQASIRLHGNLQNKRTLIVLDDVWAEGIVEQFSFAGVDCRLLVTTRDKKLVPNSEAINKLSVEEGLKLLATILDERNPNSVILMDTHHAIVEKLDGYTLAIEIAGRWLKKYRSETLDDYLVRLDSNEAKLFDNLKISETNKNANLSLSLALTYNSLDTDLQFYFRQLGVLAPASTVNKADLASLWQVDGDNVLSPLTTMLELGLLDDSDEDGRYSQHIILRAYARQAMKGDELSKASSSIVVRGERTLS
ncbi:MAG: NB-ARC domain-containing protein, partial [Chloroflexota bacterium]